MRVSKIHLRWKPQPQYDVHPYHLLLQIYVFSILTDMKLTAVFLCALIVSLEGRRSSSSSRSSSSGSSGSSGSSWFRRSSSSSSSSGKQKFQITEPLKKKLFLGQFLNEKFKYLNFFDKQKLYELFIMRINDIRESRYPGVGLNL